ncbi:DnaJ C-terminal domain-containing protein, partial [Escherichia coli]
GDFRIDGTDLRTVLPIHIEDAVLGSEATVRTLTGPVNVTVPAWSGSDRILRLEGRGLPDVSGKNGDLLVELRIVLGEKPDTRMTDLMRARRNGLFL